MQPDVDHAYLLLGSGRACKAALFRGAARIDGDGERAYPVDKPARAPVNPAMPQTAENPQTRTFDPVEVDRFRRIASEWWDPKGKFAPLHKLGPARLQFIRDRQIAHFERTGTSLRPLDGLTVLDIGCGGGLISEPVSRMGARVTGIDPGPENVEAARRHAAEQGLTVDYRVATVEALAETGVTFDTVLCLEVIEHVPDPGAFLGVCAGLVRPGGLMIVSTINRTVKAYLLAIVGAEYVLRWLPAGTHQWERFVTPDELARHLAAAGLARLHTEGMVYGPLSDRWTLSPDTDVNYLVAAAKKV